MPLKKEGIARWNSDSASVMLGSRTIVVSRLKERQPNFHILMVSVIYLT